VLLSLLQLQASLRIRTAVISNANPTVLCCCDCRLTVGIFFSFRPIRYRPDPPYRGPHCDNRYRHCFFLFVFFSIRSLVSQIKEKESKSTRYTRYLQQAFFTLLLL